MTRSRILVKVGASLAGLALLVLPVAPAVAGPVHVSNPTASRTSGNGSERMCVGVDDPEGVGNSTTWVCSPEARWYADMIVFVLDLVPV